MSVEGKGVGMCERKGVCRELEGKMWGMTKGLSADEKESEKKHEKRC